MLFLQIGSEHYKELKNTQDLKWQSSESVPCDGGREQRADQSFPPNVNPPYQSF